LLYRAVQAAAFPFFLLYVLRRGLRDRRYFHGVGERFGFVPFSPSPTDGGVVWLHAVSVGEVVSVVTLIEALHEALPAASLYLSCSTLAGRDLAAQKAAKLVDGIFYAPFDFVWAVRRVLRRLRPRLVIVLETEIWPNLWRESKRSGASLLVVNGRIGDRAYPRYSRYRWFFAPVLALPDRILAQSDQDRGRYVELGANAELGGNLKWDVDPSRAGVAPELRAWCEGAVQLWIAASTMPPAAPGDLDEDDVVLGVWEKIREPGRRLLLVPRRPARFDLAAEKLTSRGIPFTRRSLLKGGESAPVLLLDSIGELGGLFRFATAVFMGGTLAERGGHNVLEPAAFGKPVIVGPHMENFRAIADRFASAGALIEIADPAELESAVERALRGDSDEIGERARAVAESERGATARATAAAADLYWRARPRPLVYGPLRPILWLLSRIWLAGVAADRVLSRPVRLATPVISVGGLTMGGAGKTPLVRWLAQRMQQKGLAVAVLTRGYGRKSRESVIVRRGGEASVDVTGDEGQLYIRDACAHVGIGADRVTVAREMERTLRPDVFLLDDGFQHWRLARDFDIVVVDGLSEVFPLGTMREPESALRRANLVLEKRLRISGWVPPLPDRAILGAFCALGSPESFRMSVEQTELRPVRWWNFPDHYPYTLADLRRMAAEVDVLLTTEKDAVKVPPGFPVSYSKVEFEVENGAECLEAALAAIRNAGVR
jgi:3-deoxy-D-manno-octulosonic-acid transferase